MTIFFLIVLTVALLLVLNLREHMRLSLEQPGSMFLTVFVIYYLVPLLAFVAVQGDGHTEWTVLLLTAAGAVPAAFAFFGGFSYNRPRWVKMRRLHDPATANTYLMIAGLCAAVTVANIVVSIVTGKINTHVNPLAAREDVYDSFLIVFASTIRYVPIVLAGFVGRQVSEKRRKTIKRWIYGYFLLLLAFCIVNSETRSVLTLLILTVASLRLFEEFRLPVTTIGTASVLFLAVLFFIQAVRHELPWHISGSSSLSEAGIAAALDVASNPGKIFERDDTSSGTMDRVANGPQGIAYVYDGIGRNGSVLAGKAFMHCLRSMVPRIIDHDKGAVDPLDAYLEHAFGDYESDKCINSVAYFYAEAGWIGVVGGHFLLGLLLAWVTRNALIGRDGYWWLACGLLWSAALPMEEEIPFNLLTAARSFVALYLVAFPLHVLAKSMIARSETRKLSRGRAAAIQARVVGI